MLKSSEEEQQQSHSITPIPTVNKIESTSFEPDYISASSVKRHEYHIEEEVYRNGLSPSVKQRIPTNRAEYDTIDKTIKSKRRTGPEQKVNGIKKNSNHT